MFFILGLLLIVIALIYFKRKYFTLYGPIPGTPPQFLFGNILQTGLSSGKLLGDVCLEYQVKYGDNFQFWIGPMRLVFICNPEDVKHVFTHRHIYDQGDMHVSHHRLFFHDGLMCNVGPKYKRHAAIVLPLFRRSKILNNLDLIIDCTDRLLEHWRSKTDDNQNYIHLDIVNQCQNLILNIFGFIGFDYDLQTLDESNINNKNQLKMALYDYIELFLTTFQMPEFLANIYLKLSPRYHHSMKTISEYLNQMIEQEQRKTPEEIAERKRTSLIASLVGSLQQDEEYEATKPEEEKKGLSRTEIFHEMLLFLVAGSETTGSALAWFIYLMSKHPRVQAKIKAELGENRQNRLTNEQLDSFSYLNCVLQEVFRFVPVAAGTNRTLIADDQLPSTGIKLYKGDQIFISFLNMARDKRCWKIDPDLFYPERFQSEDKNHHPYASIPFGAGHRQCIGQDLARFKLKVIAARLMQYVTFGDGGSEVNSGEFLQKLTLMPKNVGITITFD